jgi:hypothetical protein
MPLITREEKGSKLSIEEMDGNLIYLDNKAPYKVYTALLTQGGGDNQESFAWEYLDPVPEVPTLLDGVSYYIDSNDSNTDFTIAGAPNNNGGTSFVANGTQPDWQPPFEIEGNYIQIEYNTGAPVVTVLENTIGNIWFTYSFLGEYLINSDNLFSTKLFMQDGFISAGDGWLFTFSQESQSQIKLLSFSSSGNADSLFDNTPIEIRVYN